MNTTDANETTTDNDELRWTSRTPNGIVYTICAAALTWAAVRRPAGEPAEARPEPEAVTA